MTTEYHVRFFSRDNGGLFLAPLLYRPIEMAEVSVLAFQPGARSAVGETLQVPLVVLEASSKRWCPSYALLQGRSVRLLVVRAVSEGMAWRVFTQSAPMRGVRRDSSVGRASD